MKRERHGAAIFWACVAGAGLLELVFRGPAPGDARLPVHQSIGAPPSGPPLPFVLDVFPVDASGRPNFGPTFAAPRPGGRTHNGVDIFATEGTPVRAVVPGSLNFSTNTLGGNVANLTGRDGTWFYYAHLQGYEGTARTVAEGDVIGYVGRTGNASTTPAHLHFEAHPMNGAAVDPFAALVAVAPSGSVTRAA